MEVRSRDKRFNYTTVRGENGYDKYPIIDSFIPEAISVANEQFTENQELSWDRLFLTAMDVILERTGLRVL